MAKENLPEIVFRKRDLSLTGRERDVLQLFARGVTYKAIADELGVSSGSVGRFMHRIRIKIRSKTREDIIRAAIELGLMKPKGK